MSCPDRLCLLALLLFVSVATAYAQEPGTPSPATPAPATTPAATPPASTAAFPKGTEYFTLAAGFQNERNGANEYLASVITGFGRYFWDNAGFELQVVGYHGHDGDDNTVGLGGNALARYHFLNFGRASIYGDVLGGVFLMSDNFPSGGTGFNFTYGGGPGLSWRLRDGLYLDGGLRFQHVSNGFVEGRDRNPIFNSFGGYVGLTWTR